MIKKEEKKIEEEASELNANTNRTFDWLKLTKM